MKYIIAFALLISTIAISKAQEGQPLDIDRITQLVEEYVEEENIPSVVVGLVQDGELRHVISRGEMKRGSGQAVNQATGYQIASLSKSFTAIILRHLEAEGKLSMDQSIASFMKDEINAEALPQYEKMSLADVLQHRSGLPNNGESIPPTPNGAPMLGGYTQEGFLKDLSSLKIDQDKVGKFNYSNLGFGLLGHIAEKVSGQSYEELLKKYILEPNNMGFTTSLLNEATRSRLATPYMVGGDRTAETKPWEMGKNIPAGGILSNVEDLSRLMIKEMEAYKAYKENGTSSPYVLVEDALPLNDYMHYGYGFFESRNTFDTTVVQLGHGGDVDGFGSHYEFYPEHGVGLIILTASGAGGFNELKSRVERVMVGIPLPKEISVTKEVLRKYTGTYEFESGTVIKLYRKGTTLKAYVRGWWAQEIYPESETRFNWRDRNEAFEFELDEKGKLARAVFWQNGKRYYPKKIK